MYYFPSFYTHAFSLSMFVFVFIFFAYLYVCMPLCPLMIYLIYAYKIIAKCKFVRDAVCQHCEEVCIYPIIIGTTGPIHQRTW